MKNYLLFFSLLGLAACHLAPHNPPDTSVELNQAFAEPKEVGRIVSDKIQEASGLAYSRRYPNALWVHNDSGNDNILFLINEKGETLAEVSLEGIVNRDWEDIAIYENSETGESFIYLGEMGDNEAIYPDKFLYKFAEPKLDIDKSFQKLTIPRQDIIKIEWEFPDGNRDSESLMIDPLTEDIYIVSKREDSVRVYHLPQKDIVEGKSNPLRKIAQLHFKNANAADISRDGLEILVKTYGNVYYWQRESQQSLREVFNTKPQRLPYTPEPQGESVAWKPDRSGYMTTTEERDGADAKMLFYERK